MEQSGASAGRNGTAGFCFAAYQQMKPKVLNDDTIQRIDFRITAGDWAADTGDQKQAEFRDRLGMG